MQKLAIASQWLEKYRQKNTGQNHPTSACWELWGRIRFQGTEKHRERDKPGSWSIRKPTLCGPEAEGAPPASVAGARSASMFLETVDVAGVCWSLGRETPVGNSPLRDPDRCEADARQCAR